MKRINLFSVFIPGIPVAQPRHRMKPVLKRKGLLGNVQLVPGVAAYTPDNGVKRWKSTVAMLVNSNYSGPLIETGPIGVSLIFWLPQPTDLPDFIGFFYQFQKPDLDNLEKAIFDAITRTGRVWKDDSQVSYSETFKLISAEKKRVGVNLEVFQLSNPEEINRHFHEKRKGK